MSISSEHLNKLPIGSIVNEKHNQTPNASDGCDEVTNFKSNAPKADDDGGGSGSGDGSGDDGAGSNRSDSRELNFLNLKLQCMCSDDDASVITKSNVDPSISKRQSVDDDTEIEISEVEAVTEIGESIFENHRCTHCGRGHCCFFLRCCYCIASGNVLHESSNNQNNDINETNAMALHENNPCQSECETAHRKANSNNIPNEIPIGSSCSKQNLASKRCDEICKIIRNQHGMGLCISSTAATNTATTTTVLAKKQCCEEANVDNVDKHGCTPKSIAIGCHCRWYCIQDCDSDAKMTTTASINVLTEVEAVDRPKTETTLAVQEPEIVSPITNEPPLMDENRLRCCRCSKELA